MAHVVLVVLRSLFSALKNESEPTVHQRLTGETKTCELNQKQVSPDRWIIVCTSESMLILIVDFLICKYVELCVFCVTF